MVTSGGGLLLAGGSSPPRVALANGSCMACQFPAAGGAREVASASGIRGAETAPRSPVGAADWSRVSCPAPPACSEEAGCLLQPVNINAPRSAATIQRRPAPFPCFAQPVIMPSPSEQRLL